MAAVGASGLSLVLGVYNTQQIATLKETIASISGSSAASTVLSTTVVPPPKVVQPVKVAVQQPAFQAASSSEIKELQQRLEELETFSNNVSSSSAANSASMSQSVGGLATNISDLEIFANATRTKSSTNEGKLVMLEDEVGRLTTIAAEIAAKQSTGSNVKNATALTNLVKEVDTLGDGFTLVDSGMQEIRVRLGELESSSNSASTSSTSNSSNMSQSVGGLATSMGDLEIFANATDTRSTTNETNIVMLNDEIDRLTTFATGEIVSVRDRMAVAEESVSTNVSNIALLATSVGDVATGVFDANTRIDAAIAQTTGVETSLATTQTAVDQSTSSITQNSTALTALVQEMAKMGDDLGLVNGNETETRNNLASLGVFANATDTRSTTNETNIVTLSGEVDRLTTFATGEIVSAGDRLTAAEELGGNNASNITLLATSVGDVATGVSDANTRIDAAIALTMGVETSLAATQAAADQSTSSIAQNSNALTGLAQETTLLKTSVGDVATGVSDANTRIDAAIAQTTGVETSLVTTQATVDQSRSSIAQNSNAIIGVVQEMNKLGDDLGLVNAKETETSNNLASLGASWNELNANAYVANGWLNAVNLKATNCKLGLTAHNGQTSALHFASLNDPNWSIYVSSATGKAPDGTTPKTHGDVTRNAVRMRLDSSSTSGFILEKSDGVGVFSVNAQGNAVMENASMKKCHVADGSIGKLGSGAAFAYKTHLSDKNYAMMQYPSGNTYLNCKPSSNVILCNGLSQKATVTAKGFHAKSQSGSNYQVGDEIQALRSKVVSLETRLDDLEKKSKNFLDRSRTVKFYNQASKGFLRKYKTNQLRCEGSSGDVQNHFTIYYD